MRVALTCRMLPVALSCIAASGCDTKMVHTWYYVPNYQRHYSAAPGAAPACLEAAERATRLCPREARIATWPTDVRCSDAEWDYADHCLSDYGTR